MRETGPSGRIFRRGIGPAVRGERTVRRRRVRRVREPGRLNPGAARGRDPQVEARAGSPVEPAARAAPGDRAAGPVR